MNMNRTDYNYDEMKKNLKRGIVNDEMIDAALYSLNKRAKNWRDKAEEIYLYNRCRRGYGWVYDKYGQIDRAVAEKKRYYAMKEEIIRLYGLQPIAKHVDQHENHYAYYSINGYGYHQPVSIEVYERMQVAEEEIDLVTEGHDTADLISVQFCQKLLNILKSK